MASRGVSDDSPRSQVQVIKQDHNAIETISSSNGDLALEDLPFQGIHFTHVSMNPNFVTNSSKVQQHFSHRSPTDKHSPLLNTKDDHHVKKSPTSPFFEGKLILKKTKSMSFFIELYSPDATKINRGQNHSSINFPIPSSKFSESSDLHATNEIQVNLQPQDESESQAQIYGNSNQEKLAVTISRLLNASLRRSAILHERRIKLKERYENIKFRSMLQKQKERLQILRVKAKLSYSQSAAYYRREVILREKIYRSGSSVEHAQTVAMTYRLRRALAFKRSFSESFLDVVDKENGRSRFIGQLIINDEKNKDVIKDDKEGKLENEIHAGRDGDPALIMHKESIESSLLMKSKNNNETHESQQSQNIANIESNGSQSHLPIRRCKSLPLNTFEFFGNVDDTEEFLDLLPPITRYTLRELDLDQILGNAQLRHDLYFDPNLQFKPNVEGDRGIQKAAKMSEFWKEVQEEVEQGHTYRIPLLIHEIRQIMIELIPNIDDARENIERNIDIKLIAQQVEHKVLNAGKLIKFIAEILKANCAPVRDEIVDRMVFESENGYFIAALRICFELLELMKLDMANHQLHRLRPYVMEHAIEYEWRWFKEQFEAKKIVLDNTISWFQESKDRCLSMKRNSFTEIYNDGLIHLISQAHILNEIAIPETLHMDGSRLISFYNDAQDITILCSLLILFRQVAGSRHTVQDLMDMKQILWILLNDAETSMSHIAIQLATTGGKIRRKMFAGKEMELLDGLVNRTLASDNQLYSMIRQRIYGHLRDYLDTGEFNPTTISKHGLSELQEELTNLSKRIKMLADHNKSTYSPVYNVIMNECNKKNKGNN